MSSQVQDGTQQRTQEDSAHSIAEFVRDWVRDNSQRIVDWRRHLHRNPELSHIET